MFRLLLTLLLCSMTLAQASAPIDPKPDSAVQRQRAAAMLADDATKCIINAFAKNEGRQALLKTVTARKFHSSPVCIVLRRHASDPKSLEQPPDDQSGNEFNEAVTEAVISCSSIIKHMMRACDDFLSGSGKRYFLGPYLDEIPHVLHKQLEERAGQ